MRYPFYTRLHLLCALLCLPCIAILPPPFAPSGANPDPRECAEFRRVYHSGLSTHTHTHTACVPPHNHRHTPNLPPTYTNPQIPAHTSYPHYLNIPTSTDTPTNSHSHTCPHMHTTCTRRSVSSCVPMSKYGSLPPQVLYPRVSASTRPHLSYYGSQHARRLTTI